MTTTVIMMCVYYQNKQELTAEFCKCDSMSFKTCYDKNKIRIESL